MTKENYERTELEVFHFQTADVITTSGWDEYEEQGLPQSSNP